MERCVTRRGPQLGHATPRIWHDRDRRETTVHSQAVTSLPSAI
jgi:hypothetical protein